MQRGARLVIKEIVQVGNSHALIIDKPILQMLGLSKGAKVHFYLHGSSLVITPVDSEAVGRDQVGKAEKRVLDQYEDVLDRLGE